ncbi:1-aminocyclopropane-1-carboxylate deaminase/D-cysteine desulfhydrase [Undibacterium baiyunense]|uniref:Pyridoxal-phosphate dependent enzyme n=1 Tax=Undibacterium baiyunense TaxID=2828731 RepID=A0A941DJS6_9BURK|nr:pyridoxal-phosphate dependent enzyme [Undibacterium baiyunense]MBR7748157.1 pyridoxal-phosphate dependent enzyme [Undibacterium baiyunense]
MHFMSYSSPLQIIESQLFPGIALWVKRDDLLHPQVSGNKFRKLKYPLSAALLQRANLISMGGAWSNHLHALAHAGHLLGLKTTGLVRGLVPNNQTSLSPTLQDCQSLGMRLHFLSRLDYRELRLNPNYWQRWIETDPAEYFWLPEGGSSAEAVRGVAELIDELDWIPDTIILACGTGATLAGIVMGMHNQGRVIGIAAVQNAGYLKSDVQQLLLAAENTHFDNFEILHQFTHGGFAKVSPTLMHFCEQFTAETDIPLEPVYTGKMFYSLHQLCISKHFKEGEKVIAIHTGGLQGNRGFDLTSTQ